MAEKLDYRKSPTALFCALETALAKGEFLRAAELRESLAKLGFRVTIRIPKAHAPKADKTGGAQ
jgi:hypothetical protein